MLCFAEWRRESEYFVTTKAALETMKCLDTSPCVVVTGSSGSGKSSIVHNAALSLQDQGFNIHLVDELSQIFQTYQHKAKTAYVLDDPFGKGTIYREKILEWEANQDKLKHVLQFQETENLFKKKIQEEETHTDTEFGKTIILISCRLNLYRNHLVTQIANALKFQECDLSLVHLCLTLTEKEEMFAKYIGNVKFESVRCDMDYFPLVCMLSCGHSQKVISKSTETYQGRNGKYEK